MRAGATGTGTNPHFSTAQAHQAKSSGVPPQWLPVLLASSVGPQWLQTTPSPSPASSPMPAGIEVLSCTSVTGWQIMIQYQVTAYSDDKQLFDAFDTDGDGYVVKGEALANGRDEDEWQHKLETHDADNDEKLGLCEFLALLADQRESAKAEQASHYIDHYEASSTFTDGNFYESPAYQDLLAKRAKEVEAAEASAVVGKMSLSARHDLLRSIFSAADTNDDSKVSPSEYTAAGKNSRYAVVQAGFKEAIDTDSDGVVSERQALNAAAFEFDVLDGDRDGVVSFFELEHVLENKGWLRKKDWHVALTLATDKSLPHLITAFVETHWGDAPEEDYGDEEACEASKVQGQSNTPSLADDAARLRESESETLPSKHVNTSATTRRLGFAFSNPEGVMSTALSAGFAEVTRILGTDFCWIKSYDRGVGRPAGCAAGWYQRGAMCYRICPSGSARHDYDIEFCSYGCPSGSTNTGLFCRTNGWTKSKSCCYSLGVCWVKCCGGCPSGHTNTGCFCEPCVTLASILLCFSLPPHPTSPARYAHTRRVVSLLAGARLCGGATTHRAKPSSMVA